MPNDSKRNSNKGKSDAKEQRKKRQGRQHAAPVEKKVTMSPEAMKDAEPEKPAYEPPGEEFYQGLKRETDEILKLTEESNAKYKNKEIKSNWAKYEMPMETYDEKEEQESYGADYEALIQASLSVGGDFQFKHEKFWDASPEPNEYFDIDTENLYAALLTIPFYERNNLDLSIFSESDIKSMDDKATKYKQKYYDDKTYTTPDLETQEKIIKILTSNDSTEDSYVANIEEYKTDKIYLDQSELNVIQDIFNDKCVKDQKETATTIEEEKNDQGDKVLNDGDDDIDDEDFYFIQKDLFVDDDKDKVKPGTSSNQVDDLSSEIKLPKVPIEGPLNVSNEQPKNVVTETQEDLEKWLDEILDS